MSVLVQYLNFLKSSPGENEKKEKKAELPGYAPSVAGSIDNEKKDEDKLTSSITDHGLVSQETPKNINASSAEPVAMRSSSSAAAPAFTQPVANPGRGYNTGVPRPQTQQQPTKIPRVLESIPMANSVNDPRSGTLLDKQGSLGYSRNTGISDVEGEIYVNGNDVELLGKLGFEYICEEYLGLEKTSEVLDVYSYIEKVAGVPKEVAKLIDAGQAFSGEYLKDMGYSVPKGYEVKGDLVCPVEKTEESFQQTGKEKKGSSEKTASRLRSNVNITKHDDPSGLTEYIASIGDKKIGNMLVADSKYKGKVVAHSLIDPEFRGMGLGKKLYGEVMRRQPEGVLHSGPVMSEDAQRVWASLNKNKGYEIAGEAPELMGRINEKALNIPNKVKKLHPAVSAVEAKGSIFARIKKLMGIAKRAEHEKEAAEAIASPGMWTTPTGSWHRSGDGLVNPQGRVMNNTPNSKPMAESPYLDIAGNVGMNALESVALRGAKKLDPLNKDRMSVSLGNRFAATKALKNVAKAVPGVVAGFGVSDAHDRWQKEDYTGAMMSGLGAAGDVAQLFPHPVAKGVGLTASWGGTAANAARDINRYNNRPVEFRNTLPSLPQPSIPQPSTIQQPLQSLAKQSEADHPVNSSNIKAVGHDKKEKVLDVAFHSGSEYAYKNVPRSLYDRLLKAKSPGKFFNKHIKKDKPFEYEKVAGIPEHLRRAMSTGDKALLQAAQSKSVASRIANIAAKKRKLEVAKLLGNEEPKLLQRGEEFQKHFPFSVSHEFEQAKKTVDPLYRPDLSKYLGKPKV